MKFQFTNAEKTQVQGSLDEGESFGYHTGPTTFSMGMAPGNRDFDTLFPNAEVETDPATNMAASKSWGDPTHPIADFVPPPAGPIVIAKVDLLRKLTDKEYADLMTAVGQQSPRLQGIFTAAQNFRSDAPGDEWANLSAVAVQTFGKDRAAELLNPETYAS